MMMHTVSQLSCVTVVTEISDDEATTVKGKTEKLRLYLTRPRHVCILANKDTDVDRNLLAYC